MKTTVLAPRALVLDVVGTVLRPTPSVSQAYFQAGQRFGSRLDANSLAARFPRALANHFGQRTATDEAEEKRRWFGVVAEVFRGDVAEEHLEPLFDSLWAHFARPEHWSLFDDVIPAWRRWEAAGFTIVLASNFDERLFGICRELEPLRRCERIFVSSRVGFPKPCREFFQHIQQALGYAPRDMLMVGDDYENDYQGALSAGWQSLWLRRNESSHPTPSIRSLAEV